MQLNPDSAVRQVTWEVGRHVAASGWDQPARLFALVRTEELLQADPQLAGTVSGEFTPVEQDGVPRDRQIEEVLPTIGWPEAVHGCAVVVERIMLPTDAEDDLPTGDEEALVRAVAEHPLRREVRIAVGVLRDGSAHCVVTARTAGGEGEPLEGPDLTPGLVELVRDTLSLSEQ